MLPDDTRRTRTLLRPPPNAPWGNSGAATVIHTAPFSTNSTSRRASPPNPALPLPAASGPVDGGMGKSLSGGAAAGVKEIMKEIMKGQKL